MMKSFSRNTLFWLFPAFPHLQMSDNLVHSKQTRWHCFTVEKLKRTGFEPLTFGLTLLYSALPLHHLVVLIKGQSIAKVPFPLLFQLLILQKRSCCYRCSVAQGQVLGSSNLQFYFSPKLENLREIYGQVSFLR